MSLPDELERVKRLTGTPAAGVTMHGSRDLPALWLNETEVRHDPSVRPGEARIYGQEGGCVSITNIDVDE